MISKREFRDGWFREIFPWRHLIKTKCLFDLFIVFLYGDPLTWDHILYLVIFRFNQPISHALWVRFFYVNEMIWYLMEQELSIYTSGAPDTWHDLIPTGAGTQYLHFRSTWYLAWSDTYWSTSSVFTLPEHLISGMIWYLLEHELSVDPSRAPDIWNDLIPTGAGTATLPVHMNSLLPLLVGLFWLNH
jgi:hypothetical protein